MLQINQSTNGEWKVKSRQNRKKRIWKDRKRGHRKAEGGEGKGEERRGEERKKGPGSQLAWKTHIKLLN